MGVSSFRGHPPQKMLVVLLGPFGAPKRNKERKSQTSPLSRTTSLTGGPTPPQKNNLLVFPLAFLSGHKKCWLCFWLSCWDTKNNDKERTSQRSPLSRTASLTGGPAPPQKESSAGFPFGVPVGPPKNAGFPFGFPVGPPTKTRTKKDKAKDRPSPEPPALGGTPKKLVGHQKMLVFLLAFLLGHQKVLAFLLAFLLGHQKMLVFLLAFLLGHQKQGGRRALPPPQNPKGRAAPSSSRPPVPEEHSEAVEALRAAARSPAPRGRIVRSGGAFGVGRIQWLQGVGFPPHAF